MSRQLVENNDLQTSIMRFVDQWAKTQKTPIPQREIVIQMEKNGVKTYTTVNALNILLRKRFIRRAIVVSSNKTFYVQLRRV